MGGIERQSGASLRARTAPSQRGASGELADLAADLAGAVARDGHLVVEPVSRHHLHGALEHKPGRRLSLANVVDDLAGRE